MNEIFELSKYFTPSIEQYKLNLHILRQQQVDFGIKICGSLGPRLWNSMFYHIKSAKNLNRFQNPVKKWNTYQQCTFRFL